MLEASGIPAPIVKAMSDKGYENLTPVQEEVFKDDYLRTGFACIGTNWLR